MNKKVQNKILSIALTVVLLLTLAQFAAVPAYAATGTMNIGGQTGVSLASDQSGTGWSWTAGANQNVGLSINNGTGSLDLSGLTGTFTATGGTQAIDAAAPSYPAGPDEPRKYNGTAANYTLDMTGGSSGTPIPGDSGIITVSDIGQNSLTLNWTKATHDKTVDYYVFQSTSANLSTLGDCLSDQQALLNNPPDEDIDTYLVTGLSPNTTYWFNVVAADQDMNMAAYTMVSATTAGGGSKTVSVGAQNGALTEGTAGSATYVVTTANIGNGTYPVTLTGAPTGVTADNITISSSSGTLTLNTTAGTSAGTHPLTITIDGAVSNNFSLEVSAVPVKITGPYSLRISRRQKRRSCSASRAHFQSPSSSRTGRNLTSNGRARTPLSQK